MSAEASGNGKDSGGKVVEIKVPMLTITFDPRNCSVDVTGQSPSLFFSKYMLLMALEKVTEHIAAAQQPIIEVPGGAFSLRKGG
jgi:hypothetical protein